MRVEIKTPYETVESSVDDARFLNPGNKIVVNGSTRVIDELYMRTDNTFRGENQLTLVVVTKPYER